jgi:Fe-Mn family superoxide dismutase
MFVSSGAAFGSFAAPALAAEDAAGTLDWSASGLATGQPKPLRHESIPGFLSAEQIAPHHTAHYGGALKTFVGIESRFDESVQSGTALDPAAFESLERTRSSRGNSVLLHELYFDGLSVEAGDPAAELRAAIERRFGSLDRWMADFAATARAAAGWALLVRHPVNGRLYNVLSDEHAFGPLWLAMPLVVIDVYEHAYYIDYQNRKAEYVEKFLGHIDWEVAGVRYRSLGA